MRILNAVVSGLVSFTALAGLFTVLGLIERFGMVRRMGFGAVLAPTLFNPIFWLVAIVWCAGVMHLSGAFPSLIENASVAKNERDIHIRLLEALCAELPTATGPGGAPLIDLIDVNDWLKGKLRELVLGSELSETGSLPKSRVTPGPHDANEPIEFRSAA